MPGSSLFDDAVVLSPSKTQPDTNSKVVADRKVMQGPRPRSDVEYRSDSSVFSPSKAPLFVGQVESELHTSDGHVLEYDETKDKKRKKSKKNRKRKKENKPYAKQVTSQNKPYAKQAPSQKVSTEGKPASDNTGESLHVPVSSFSTSLLPTGNQANAVISAKEYHIRSSGVGDRAMNTDSSIPSKERKASRKSTPNLSSKSHLLADDTLAPFSERGCQPSTSMYKKPTEEQIEPMQDRHHSSQQQAEMRTLRAFCSESFLEGWSEASALLASGQWTSLCRPLGRDQEGDEPPRLGQRIQLFDTPLLDEASIDIEVSGHAIIVHRLSEWQESGVAKTAAKRLARLTALGRYERLDVIICADVDVSPAQCAEIAFLQSAVIRQPGTTSRPPSFQVIAPRLLAPVLAVRVYNSQSQAPSTDSFMDERISDVRVQERARFLLSICPLLTVCGAVELLLTLSRATEDDADYSRQSFQQLMTLDGPTRHSRLIGKLVSSDAPALQQLMLAIHISLSNDG